MITVTIEANDTFLYKTTYGVFDVTSHQEDMEAIMKGGITEYALTDKTV